MTNNERFNAMLNGCQHPRAVYNVLYALAPAISETRPAFPEEALAELKHMSKDEAAAWIRCTYARHVQDDESLMQYVIVQG